MITDDLCKLIAHHIGHTPTEEQRILMERWKSFLFSRSNDKAFILKGYAGTGKTTMIAALVKTMRTLHQHVILLAPTGRASKVFANYAQTPALTIHKKIYRQRAMDDTEHFQLAPNMHQHTLFIVDEASMIANEGLSGSMFGTGRLLDDLVQFVYSGQGCRLLLVGDTAQLPPVGEAESPALNSEVMECYDLDVEAMELCQVLRQEEDSGILWNATRLRQRIAQRMVNDFPHLRATGFADVTAIKGGELIEALEDSYTHYGEDETIVLTRSNKRANIYNDGIRSRIFCYEEELSSGDRLMVAKNNYYWMGKDVKNTQQDTEASQTNSFIANGDMAVVRRLRNERSLYGFSFADAVLRFPDYDDMELEATILLDTLHSEAPALTRQQQEALFHAVWEDYPDMRKAERIKRIKEDIYYNALQVKHAYAVTCHKAQGGQWQCVFIDQGYVTEDMLSPDYFRWLYTAITRATERVYLVNFQTE
ncbi:MAG: AAA family ATPase [Bacteroidaceae bacterium]|nr:AAA family ATPase [Bacteroidaceae bacterium]